MRLTLDRFDLGIDVRKGSSVSDANRLREMKNCYVTTGLATAKRPGFTKVATLEAGTKGLVAAFGWLNTFKGGGSPVLHANPLFKNWACTYGGDNTVPVTDVFFADSFPTPSGERGLYCVLEREATVGGVLTRFPVHHYLGSFNATGDKVADANCPHTPVMAKAASKLFAVSKDGATVRYCATGNANDWSATNDAGFLPTGANARGDRATRALGMYQSKLVALASDAAQVWQVDPDPTAMKLFDVVENVGSSYPLTQATVAGDLYFLSDYGFRSITTQAIINKIADVDIGSPIDSLVRPDLALFTGKPVGGYFYGTGQYMCVIDQTMYVYTISKTAGIAAWSRYALPFTVDAMAQLDRVLYLRSGDNVYKLNPDVSTDDGEDYEALLELPYLNFKSPGSRKYIHGMELLCEGDCYFSLGWDSRNAGAVSPEVRVQGNTRGGGIVPIECVGYEFSPRFRIATDTPFRLDALTLFYDEIGP